MLLNFIPTGRQAVALTVLGGWLLPVLAAPAPVVRRSSKNDPFAVLDPQNWVNPDNMTWADYVPPPSTDWSNPDRKGSMRNFNIALVVVDYPDHPFVISQPAESTIFGNPQQVVSGLDRADVPAFYRDFLNKPQDLNREHTLHEYWMEDSGGRYGVDLTAFGAYEMPQKSYQYGISTREADGAFNEGACPDDGPCNVDLRTDALGAWRADVGNASANSYELVFILSAGQDESSTWQEFGQMRFQTRQDVTDAFGPPDDSSENWAHTRYVDWTSWASAATIWPNAGDGSSTQGESSGMAVYAHELSHLLFIGDNYNDPYETPPVRSFTGPWSMMSRGSFNGPGGPHTRWQIPAQHGSSLGSHHTVRDKWDLGLLDNSTIVNVSRKALEESGPIVATITARSVVSDLMALRVTMGKDLEPFCNMTTQTFCDGGGYDNYDMEVVDRMGSDSFTPDSGVMLSKTKNDGWAYPFQYMIDANPQDIDLVDFYRPDGTPSMVSIGDYRQLSDALFHAGTRSGSQYEHVDRANRLHFYVIDIHRDESGVLRYTVGIRSLDSDGGSSTYGVKMSKGHASPGKGGATCSFELTNSGSYKASGNVSKRAAEYMKSDVYRLSAEVEGEGWKIALPNALATAPFGDATMADVAVDASTDAASEATVILTATSESDSSVSVMQKCVVKKSQCT
ncbi:hypothetical protein LTR37_010608 [Vermiconidia calcicola]|uniref:Uncharacterized protein n=1 Tax=Vermiconidia calcicola TaxID=1690605 RepID=A0ACC3N4L5_9PEZI|nr:hypothetical protein LTR37_010608 [Vermiconidia calcicola]